MDHVIRNARKEASRKEAAIGWYRTVEGGVSFSGFAGLAMGVKGYNDSKDGDMLSMERYRLDGCREPVLEICTDT